MKSTHYPTVPVGKGLSWGWKIALLYGGFMALIISLVVASSHQHFDLVSKNYYEEEIAYQKVIDAGKNQSALSHPMSIHADSKSVFVDFPDELKGKVLSGTVQFYSPVDAQWDRTFKIEPQNNSIAIPRNALHNTRYTIKVSCVADGKNYYQESEIMLH
jgi:nitrogen fixation protein FixH